MEQSNQPLGLALSEGLGPKAEAYASWLAETHAPALRKMDSEGAHAAGWSAGVDAERLRIAAAIREAWHEQEAAHGNRAGQHHEGVLAGLDAAVALALGPNV